MTVDHGNRDAGVDDGRQHVIPTMTRTAVIVTPAPLDRRQQLVNGGEQVGVASRPGLDDGYPGGGVGNEHGEQPVTPTLGESGDVGGDVHHRGTIPGAHRDLDALQFSAGELDHHVPIAETHQEVGEHDAGVGLGLGQDAIVEGTLDQDFLCHLPGVSLQSRIALGE